MHSRSTFTLFVVFTICLAYSIFLLGFFPVKTSMPDHAAFRNFTLSEQHSVFQPNRKHEKTVLVLIDALRSDFVYQKKHMSFVQTKVQGGFGKGYVVKAHPPTVTLPRIKALTSGSIPGFVDVVLNFDSTSLAEDNIITQAKSNGRKVVFYGDDTWIKLFPDHFLRSEGTTSFFVTDYTEVDNNVTRHLDKELALSDWDMMILHYLGLDHIGHTAGPTSPLVPPKLREMDDIIRKIYEALERQEREFVMLVCGDHGMSDQGSHGGASDSEILVPAVFLSPTYKQHDDVWQSSRDLLQIDVAATLSVLLGLPIPSNNLGQILLGALAGLSNVEKLNSLYINTQQIVKLLQQNVPDFSKERSFDVYEHAVKLHEEFLSSNNTSDASVARIFRSYETAMEMMSNKISGSLTTYDLYCMVLAVVILTMCFFVLLKSADCNHLHISDMMSPIGFGVLSIIFVFGHMTCCTSQSLHSSTLCGRSLGLVSMQLVVFICLQMLCAILWTQYSNRIRKRVNRLSLETWFWAGTVLHSFSFGSSSFVEEEHQTWYFLTMTTYLIFICCLVTNHLKLNSCKTCDQHTTEVQYYGDDKAVLQHSLTSDSRPSTTYKPKLNVSMNTEVSLLPWKSLAAMVTVMLLGRVMRIINQTGNKWLDTPDAGDWLVRPENKEILSMLMIISLVVILVVKLNVVKVEYLCFMAGLVACYQYRVSTHAVIPVIELEPTNDQLSKGTLPARCVYSMILLMNLIACIRWMFTRNRHSMQCNITTSETSDRNTHVGQHATQLSNSDENENNSNNSSLHATQLRNITLEQRAHNSNTSPRATQLIDQQTSTTHQNSSTSPRGGQSDFFNSNIVQRSVKTVPPTTGEYTDFHECDRINTASTDTPPHVKDMKIVYLGNLVQTLQLSWLLLTLLLLKTHNTFLVAMMILQEWLLWEHYIKHSKMNSTGLALFCWWMGQAVYFQQGNSNSISSVDVSAGYVGLLEYQPVLVAVLLVASTYAAPIYWLISLLKFILHRHIHRSGNHSNQGFHDNTQGNSTTKCILDSIRTILLERVLTLVLYCVIVTSQRYHLFVWTVFSPKLLYEGMLTAVFSTVAVIYCALSNWLLPQAKVTI